MIVPTEHELRTLIADIKGNFIVPIYLTMKADLLTPVSAYLKLSSSQTHSFLFESVEGGSKIGRYSFLGSKPTKTSQLKNKDPLKDLEEDFSKFTYVKVDGIPSFTGGAVGYVSFDCIEYFEPKTKKQGLQDVLSIPEAQFMFYDEVVVFDHLHHVINIIVHYKNNKKDVKLEDEYQILSQRLYYLKDFLNAPDIPLPLNNPPQKTKEYTEWVSNVGKEGYESFVEFLKSHITDGDIVQAVPSQRISRKTFLHPFNAYRELRSVNPSPYMFYLDFNNFQIVGASPEMMCKVENRKVTTHPIAGTRKRGKTKEENDKLINELLKDEKETSEHVMLVDLGRNDVNRVCDPRTVKVDSLMHVEIYSHVMHIVSHVSGTLRPEKSQFDAFRSIFPAGTVSGAPKIKAIELIRECEKEKRGVYAGAVGYFSYSGDLDTAIAIRTLVFKYGNVYLQAGGGIVYDSNKSDEYEETSNKLGSSIAAISRAETYYSQ